ncbi:MAG: TonB-dependent receptor [bacterium]|nr:TonB-dependent receptor [bacterium]
MKDFATGRPIENASVAIAALDLSALTDARGSFEIKNIPPGRHVVTVTKSGYHEQTFEHDVSSDDRGERVALELTPTDAREHSAEYQAEQPRYEMPEVTVLTTRAGSRDPVTLANLSANDVNERSYAQDLPMLLTELPNVTAYSDGGQGFGYSYLRMRGFGQHRVAVQVNGTPLNDAGTGEVFWIDLPDFAEDVEDIQVQRGVGSSLYGAAALGGTINLVTKTPGQSDRPSLRAEATYGRWNTRRAMISLESGRIEDRYGIAARLTRMESDGYRFGSWTKLWSYYLAAARFTDAHVTRAVFYGGPEQTHLSYYGVPKEYLDGNVTGDKEFDRRFNRLEYPNEIDNFFQPHYELHDEWTLSDKLRLDQSFYVYHGDGCYDQWKPDSKLKKYFYDENVIHVSDTLQFERRFYDTDDTGFITDTLPGGDVAYRVTKFDALRRRNVKDNDGGWIPRVSLAHPLGETVIGGELRLHKSHHEGILLFGNPLPQGSEPDYHYYDYRIAKQSYTGYVHNLFQITDDVRAMADVQIQRVRYQMEDDALFRVTWEKQYDFFNPRFGLWYALIPEPRAHDWPKASLYWNLSWAAREPTYKDVYDPQDYDGLPLHDGPSQLFRPVSEGLEYVGPSVKPERAVNLELGTTWQWRFARAQIVGYWMTIRDEIVPWGTQNDLGQYVSDNAEETRHRGVEITAALTPLPPVTLSGNLALTDHRFVSYSPWGVNLGGKRIAWDPPYVANLRGEFRWRGFRSALIWQGIGSQFVDNTENDDTAVPAYALWHLDLSYRFAPVADQLRAVELRVRVNNLLDTEYETFGSLDDDGVTPLYFVGAPRAVYVTTAVEL